jgi:hypothetical protein
VPQPQARPGQRQDYGRANRHGGQMRGDHVPRLRPVAMGQEDEDLERDRRDSDSGIWESGAPSTPSPG